MKHFFVILMFAAAAWAQDYTVTLTPVPLPWASISYLSDKAEPPGFYVLATSKQEGATFRGEFRVSLRYTFGGETFRVTRTFVPHSEERPKLILARFFTPAGAVPLSVSIEEVPYEPVKELNQ